jgi:nicotinate-nucleotide adenylyltransferase
MKVGLYFGSFNPIHTGHLIIANHILNYTDLKKVWFVVSPQNPLKVSHSLLNEYHRLHLVRLAIEDSTVLSASDVEFKLPRPSYTIDTLTYLKEKYPANEFSIIMGLDSYANINKWKNYEKLLANNEVIVYARSGFEVKSTSLNTILLEGTPAINISSTFIREHIRNGKSIKYLVPDKVAEEIAAAGYYKK